MRSQNLGQSNNADLKGKSPRKRKAVDESETEDKKPFKKQKENVWLEEQNRILQLENKTLSEKVFDLEGLQQEMKTQQERLVFENDSFKHEIRNLNFEFDKKTFNYICLRKKEKEFFQMCQLTVIEFDCLFACLEPFLHLIVYPDYVKKERRNSNNKLMDHKTV